ncbi:uncharacterized protein LOC130140202 isoform X2 [Syzygium oleosum]|uniref:uncharacterized protein LOC130140202 isoform X2 n=1 Tax=Syzygium oleosum TaxID=219896 RepID=UPI0024B96B0B|nr:uncharacterized protein LOC130140202 isoform X2 [Syzygium oleosum]
MAEEYGYKKARALVLSDHLVLVSQSRNVATANPTIHERLALLYFLNDWVFKSSNSTGQGGMTEAFMLCMKWQGRLASSRVLIHQSDHSTMVMYRYVLLDWIFLNYTFFLQTHGVEAPLTSLWGSVNSSKRYQHWG